jgi:hypothetical protein
VLKQSAFSATQSSQFHQIGIGLGRTLLRQQNA